MYFAERFNSSKRKNGLYHIDVTSEKTIKKTSKKPVDIIKKLNNAVFYLTAGDGKIRLFTTRKYDKKDEIFTFEYWFLHHKESKWRKIYSTETDSIEMPYRPVYITNDNKNIYVRTNKSSDKVSIHKHLSSDFSFDGIFYENDNIEITGLHIDEQTHDILGVYHVENGFHKIQYITDNDDELRHLRKQYPKHKFYVAQHNKEINKILVFGTNEYSKGSWSIYDTKSNKIEKLFETHPEYNKLEKGSFNTIKIKTNDDFTIEGYLVTPKSNTKSQFPLVVIPHGGPIGIRDFAYNNDVQHFYASHGIATLKVNYRGSGGFGKEFEASGKKQWGKQIESDINQMVDHVIQNHEISKDEICAMGSSYGGYSAIMLTIIYPERYKCAISLAGVMDLPLMFTSSDFKSYEKSLEEFKSIVGDPQTEYQKLINNSPLYLTEKISKPILLFHGDGDERVTIEHSIRMKEILDKMKKDVQLVTLKGEGHSFNNTESEIVYIARSLDFLKKNLSLH